MTLICKIVNIYKTYILKVYHITESCYILNSGIYDAELRPPWGATNK